MDPLTYSERSRLLRELDELSPPSFVSNDEIAARASEVIESITPPRGLVEPLARNVTALSGWVREDTGSSAASIGRGALVYVGRLSSERLAGPSDGVRLQSAVYITALALREIADSSPSDDLRGYVPWQLSPEDRDRAEELFLESYEHPQRTVEELLEGSASILDQLGNLRGAGFFGRFVRNIEYLRTMVQDADDSSEQQAWAQGALDYLVKKDDVIDDRLGLIGLLDDAFILQTATELIAPDRQPWQRLLDALFREWPFLNGLILDGANGDWMPSEYLLVNFALTCSELRRGDGASTKKIATVLPCVDPLPLLMGVVATLGKIQEEITRDEADISYREGDTVVVDNEAYAQFDGFDRQYGEPGFFLRWWPLNREPVRHWLPLHQLSRLKPATSRSKPRGPILHRPDAGPATVSALEYLLDLDFPAVLRDSGLATVVVTYSTTARNHASQIRISGHRLANVVPMGHLRTDGDWEMWSPSFAGDEPVLGIVADLDDAADMLSDSDRPSLAVVDLSGANGGRRSALQRLGLLDVPVVALAAESEERAVTALSEEGYTYWNWDAPEIEQLVWPDAGGSRAGNPVRRHENRIRRAFKVEPEARTIPFPAADATYEALNELRHLSRLRKDAGGVPPTLDTIQDLLRSAFFTALQTLGQDVTRRIRSLLEKTDRVLTRGSTFLTTREHEVVRDTMQSMVEMPGQSRCGQAKVEAVQELLSTSTDLRVVVKKRDDVEWLNDKLDQEGTTILLDELGHDWVADGIVVPGWFGRKRMARLLTPPVADPLVLILYDLEHQWFELQHEGWTARRQARQEQGRKDHIFPTVSGWRAGARIARSGEDTGDERIEEGLKELDWHELQARRESALRRSSSSDTQSSCEATLVWFTDDRFAFLTPERKVACVTHLLSDAGAEPAGDEDPEVRLVTVAHLRSGDSILLSGSADRDVLRAIADELIPPGTRDLAKLWQRSLRALVRNEDLDPRNLRQQLAAQGCRRHVATIRRWLEDDDIIAPQHALSGDLESIATVTDDQQLREHLEECKTAIHGVRSAHLHASQILARRVRQRVSQRLNEGMRLREIEALDDDVVLLQVDQIDEEPVEVSRTSTNRLLELEI